MLIIVRNEMKGVKTTGFETTVEGMTVTIQDGTIEFSETNELFEFEGVQFEVVADDELMVDYSVYLCGNNEIDVIRFEMVENTPPIYTGEQELLHCLSYFQIQPNATSLDNVEIKVTLIDEIVVESEVIQVENSTGTQ